MKNLIVYFLLVFSTAALADTGMRCDCNPGKRLGECRATVTLNENWLTITSDTDQCSMVNWYGNGDPQTTIVEDGVERKEWLGTSDPSLKVESCYVCFDQQSSTNPEPSDRCTMLWAQYDANTMEIKKAEEIQGSQRKDCMTKTFGENGVTLYQIVPGIDIRECNAHNKRLMDQIEPFRKRNNELVDQIKIAGCNK